MQDLFEAYAVQHLLHLALVGTHGTHRDGLALEFPTIGHGLESGVVGLHALGGGPVPLAAPSLAVSCTARCRGSHRLVGLGTLLHAALQHVDGIERLMVRVLE